MKYALYHSLGGLTYENNSETIWAAAKPSHSTLSVHSDLLH
ncbi:hypothetical protein D9757_013320 [Collybiopsis confluens]|uniref:Uncharacterized protein n=1 Tax=Collybiopsis confluens TaxID=2823264 RepID=A0A8H5LMK1_9AGAR|nr:hypothetical protein D9757_013320 [Collybiopsis confluens]